MPSEGVAGAAAFRADAALVVTWYNTASAISGQSDIDSGKLATYQVIWLTDQVGTNLREQFKPPMLFDC